MALALKKLRTAVIGCGRISVMYFSALETSETAELVACCDIKPERADEWAKKYNVPAYYDYKEMLEREELDAVYVCLPHNLHVPVAVYAFEHGVHALTEKPMSIDYASAEYAVGRAEECGRLYGVIFQCRYNNSARLVKAAVTSGRLGKIKSVRSVLTWSRSDDYYMHSDWKGTWDKEGGGVIIDQAIHSIDLVNWIVNSPVAQMSVTMANRGHKLVSVEDSCEALITYENGTKYGIFAMNNFASDEPIEIVMVCENGKATFGYDDAVIVYNDGKTERVGQNENLSEIAGAKDYWGFMHSIQIEQFHRACLGLEPLEISGKEALKTHKVIMDMYDMGGMRK